MDMMSVDDVVLTADPDVWRPGDSWLAGGTVLLSYGTDIIRGRPRRLLDLTAANWPEVTWRRDDTGGPVALELAATCRVASVFRLPRSKALPTDCRELAGLDLFRPCCDSFVASWKIWNVSTVGGNVATSLPAGPMISLLSGLDAEAFLVGPGGDRRVVPVSELVLGEACNGIGDGELVRSFTIPVAALRQPCAYRRISLRERGRSAALLIGRRTGPRRVRIVVTASTRRPHVVDLGGPDRPSTAEVWRQLVDAVVTPDGWHDDMHGAPDWRRAMTHRLGDEILAELLPDHRTGTGDARGRCTGDIRLERRVS